ncbi:MAG: type III-B CRISPR-associated protein Cas10/Cmr2 [Chthoniobacteraceae bacterium]
MGEEVEQAVQPVIGDFGDLPEDEKWKARFFAHWRLWQPAAVEKDYRFGYLPADSRIPDHTIWNHMQLVSALAGCADTDGMLRPAFLKVQLGPVQDFIAQARSTRDLWSGSYLLSWLMAAGLKALSSEIGPDAVIFPNLRGQPLFDLHWKKDLWSGIRLTEEKRTVWETIREAYQRQAGASGAGSGRDAAFLTPNLPNVFLVVVPAGKAAELGKLLDEAIRREWSKIADSVWSLCDKEGLTGDEPALTREMRKKRFNQQTEQFLSISWDAAPWPETLEEAVSLAGNFSDKKMPAVVAAKRVGAVIDMATKQMQKDHRDRRHYTDDSKTHLNNVGLAWAALVAVSGWRLDAVRQTRVFAAWGEGGWCRSAGGTRGAAHNNKDVLNGRDEAVAGGREWMKKCQEKREYWATLFKKPDWVGAITLVKRLWHISYLRDGWPGLATGSRDFPMASTRAIARGEPNKDDDEMDPEEGNEDRHFAVLALDGDEIGKWISGEKTPFFESQLADYKDGSGNPQGALNYFKRGEFKEFLKEHRPLSPGYHLQFSETLGNFALLCARPIVEAFKGRLIYAGGDDVLALVPGDKALACASALRRAFRGENPACARIEPETSGVCNGFLKSADLHERTGKDDQGDEKLIPFIVPGPRADVSVGIAIAHYKAPLQDVVRAAQTAEKRAKKTLGRAAVAVSIFKRSGEIIEWGAKWESGGLELYQQIVSAMQEGNLSGKFPHRVTELLNPYLLRKSGIFDAKGAADFDAPAVARLEFGHALERQSRRRSGRAELRKDLIDNLDGYLRNLPVPDEMGSPPHPNGAGADDGIIKSLIGLCQTVAFASRTSEERSNETAP